MKIRNFFLFTFLFNVFNLYAQDNIQAGLVGYWPIDTLLDDYSGNLNHGSYKGSIKSVDDRFGNVFQAINFNGINQFGVLGDILDTVFCKSPSATFSISGWCNPNQISGSRSVIIGKAAGGTGPYQWYIYIDTDGKLVGAVCSTSNGPNDYVEKKSLSTISINKWSHFVLTFDGNENTRTNRINIYLDTIKGGPFTNVGTLGTTTQNTNQHITIGAGHSAGNPNQPVNLYSGSIDEIRIYDRVITMNEIKLLYSYNPEKNHVVNISAGLEAYWPLDNNVFDHSGNNFNGTSLNNPSYVNDRAQRSLGGLHFNGSSQYVRFGDILDNVFSSYHAIFSVSGWIKPDTFASNRQVCIGKSAGGTGPYQWYIYIDTDNKLVSALSSTTNGPTDYVEKKSSSTLSLTNWTHFVMTFDGRSSERTNRVHIYTDTIKGSLFTNVGNMGISTQNTPQEITIGSGHMAGNPSTPVNLFKGSIDDIRIHSRVLNMSEISYLFQHLSPTGINDEQVMHNPLMVYPNPASNKIELQIDDPKCNSTILIYNQNGSVVYDSPVDTTNKVINIEHLEIGIYLILLKTNDSYMATKFIKY